MLIIRYGEKTLFTVLPNQWNGCTAQFTVYFGDKTTQFYMVNGYGETVMYLRYS